MIAPHAIQRHPSNAQPRLRVLHSGCRRACWAMMMRQARRSSAIQHYTVRCGFLSQRSYVAPSRQRRSSSKRPRKELTYCPIYGFKSFLICAKELTPALFCWVRVGCVEQHLPRIGGSLRVGPGRTRCKYIPVSSSAASMPRMVLPGPTRRRSTVSCVRGRCRAEPTLGSGRQERSCVRSRLLSPPCSAPSTAGESGAKRRLHPVEPTASRLALRAVP